jgi:hypothetical protein
VNKTIIAAGVFVLGLGYFIGWNNGHDRGAHDAALSIKTETVVADYPFSEVCSTMLEAAWSAEMTPQSVLPHN